MRGLILSGRRGTRLRPITYTSAKPRVPVADKPILFYGRDALTAAGLRAVGIVVGDTRQEIRDAVGDGTLRYYLVVARSLSAGEGSWGHAWNGQAEIPR